jgi:hypothetical protein
MYASLTGAAGPWGPEMHGLKIKIACPECHWALKVLEFLENNKVSGQQSFQRTVTWQQMNVPEDIYI